MNKTWITLNHEQMLDLTQKHIYTAWPCKANQPLQTQKRDEKPAVVPADWSFATATSELSLPPRLIVGWLPGCSDWLYSRKCSNTNHDLKSGRSDKTGPHPFRRYHKHLVSYNDSILETNVARIAEVLVKKLCQLSGCGISRLNKFIFFCLTMEYGVNCQLICS